MPSFIKEIRSPTAEEGSLIDAELERRGGRREKKAKEMSPEEEQIMDIFKKTGRVVVTLEGFHFHNLDRIRVDLGQMCTGKEMLRAITLRKSKDPELRTIAFVRVSLDK